MAIIVLKKNKFNSDMDLSEELIWGINQICIKCLGEYLCRWQVIQIINAAKITGYTAM